MSTTRSTPRYARPMCHSSISHDSTHAIPRQADGKDVIIKAFRPLPHTGLPLDVQSVAHGADI